MKRWLTLCLAGLTWSCGSDKPTEPPSENTPPNVQIVTPVAGLRALYGEEVQFTASVSDDGGSLPATSIEWLSDVDGRLGTGLELVTDQLSHSRHVITLRATDSEGMTGVATVPIEVFRTPITLQSPAVVVDTIESFLSLELVVTTPQQTPAAGAEVLLETGDKAGFRGYLQFLETGQVREQLTVRADASGLVTAMGRLSGVAQPGSFRVAVPALGIDTLLPLQVTPGAAVEFNGEVRVAVVGRAVEIPVGYSDRLRNWGAEPVPVAVELGEGLLPGADWRTVVPTRFGRLDFGFGQGVPIGWSLTGTVWGVPDLNFLAYHWGDQAWRLSTSVGEAGRTVASTPPGQIAAHPAGDWLIVPTAGGGFGRLDRDGTLLELPRPDGLVRLRDPRVSADGEWVYMIGNSPETFSVAAGWKMRPDGSELTRYTPDHLAPTEQDISPDGRLALLRDNKRGGAPTVLLNLEDGSETLISPGGASPRFSAGGDSIFVSRSGVEIFSLTGQQLGFFPISIHLFGSLNEMQPSRDGKWLLANTSREDVLLIDLVTGDYSVLIEAPFGRVWQDAYWAPAGW